MRLNLGCGDDYRKSYYNVDNNLRYFADARFDLNVIPYPIKSNSCSEILMINVLEHLDDPLKVVRELYRIAKRGAKIIIVVPHWSHFTAYGDLTHKHYFSSSLFDYLNSDDRYYDCGFGCGPKLSSIRMKSIEKGNAALLFYGRIAEVLLNINTKLSEIFLSKLFIITEIEFELCKIN